MLQRNISVVVEEELSYNHGSVKYSLVVGLQTCLSALLNVSTNVKGVWVWFIDQLNNWIFRGILFLASLVNTLGQGSQNRFARIGRINSLPLSNFSYDFPRHRKYCSHTGLNKIKSFSRPEGVLTLTRKYKK